MSEILSDDGAAHLVELSQQHGPVPGPDPGVVSIGRLLEKAKKFSGQNNHGRAQAELLAAVVCVLADIAESLRTLAEKHG